MHLDELDLALTAALRAGDLEEFNRLAAIADSRYADKDTRLSQPEALTNGAKWYAEHGIAVFPLQPGEKKPYPGSRGFKDATADLETVHRWWAARPDSNIGVPTGGKYDVIDIDGPPGYQSLADLRENGRLPQWEGRVSTPSGGMHLYIVPTGAGNGAKVGPGVDYRGVGGYVVAPPSRGANGRRWEWLNPLNTSGWGIVHTYEVDE
jgi:bifunctional DNA primase/polymerase-like protein